MATAPTIPEAEPPLSPVDLERMRLSGAPNANVRSATSDAALFTASTYVAQVLMFAAGLLQKGILGPLGAGYWALMQSFWTYLTITSLGDDGRYGKADPGAQGPGGLRDGGRRGEHGCDVLHRRHRDRGCGPRRRAL